MTECLDPFSPLSCRQPSRVVPIVSHCHLFAITHSFFVITGKARNDVSKKSNPLHRSLHRLTLPSKDTFPYRLIQGRFLACTVFSELEFEEDTEMRFYSQQVADVMTRFFTTVAPMDK